MPINPILTIAAGGLEPVYWPTKAKIHSVALAPSTSYAQGQLLYQIVGTNTNEVQRITPSGTISGGTFTITFDGATTAALPYTATAAQIKTALEGLSSIGAGNVSVSGGPINSAFVAITFINQLGYRNVPAVTVTSSLTGTSPVLTVSTNTAGVTNGVYAAYTDQSTQNAAGILKYATYVDAQGNHYVGATAADTSVGTQFSTPVYFGGTFKTSSVIGLDSYAVTDLAASFIDGDVSSGGIFTFG